jgi:hypothetical protein
MFWLLNTTYGGLRGQCQRNGGTSIGYDYVLAAIRTKHEKVLVYL